MLRESFVLLPNVRQKTEQKVWNAGVHSWDDFLGASSIAGLSASRKFACDDVLRDAKRHVREDNALFFAKALQQGEHWRLFNDFGRDAVFLDIETTGYHGGITVVGLSDGVDAKTFVRGFNLEKNLIEQELAKYKMVVTFNGASFDLPVMRKYFGMDFHMPHIDLRFVCKKVGLVGGLKSIEKQMNIHRRKEVEGFSGEDAVYLWNMWKSTGDKDYLNKLVMYNEEDILNLRPLAEKVIPQLWSKVRGHQSK